MSLPFLALAKPFTALGQHLLYDGATGALVRLSEGAFVAWREFLSAGGAGPEPPTLSGLMAAGLFRAPIYPEVAPFAQGLHSLCLNVAHACDLACSYCFADTGIYGSPRPALMDVQTARAAVDYLLANATAGRSLSIDFFGGEPLLAWPAVVEAVEYGKERAAAQGRTIRFTLTTNGVTMDRERAAFCASVMSTIIVSLDGRPEVHDRHRLDHAGRPTFNRALRGARLLAEALREEGRVTAPFTEPAAGGDRQASLREHPDLPLGAGPLWIRGTYTSANLDFAEDVAYLAGLGFEQVSMEPVALPPQPELAITREHLTTIRASYERVARMVADGRVKFFHFELNADAPACAPKRFTGCAAGTGYACVSPDGEVFACHQFDGVRQFQMGTIASASGAPAHYSPRPDLASAHVGNKAACRECWAQLHCGGGCHHAAWQANGDLRTPYALGCELQQIRLEAALGLQALLATPDRDK